MRRVPRCGLGAEILRAFTEAACLKIRRPIGMRVSRTGRPAAFRCQKAKLCALVSHGEKVQAQSWGRATGFGGIRGDAAACPARFCDRKPLIWACRLAADRLLTYCQTGAMDVTFRHDTASKALQLARRMWYVGYYVALIKRMACYLQDTSAAAQGGRGKRIL